MPRIARSASQGPAPEVLADACADGRNAGGIPDAPWRDHRLRGHWTALAYRAAHTQALKLVRLGQHYTARRPAPHTSG